MIAEYLIVDRYKRGKKETQAKWLAWFERQQAAQRQGRFLDGPPPGVAVARDENGK